MLAVKILGADGVQIGSRFVTTPEASSHIAFKNSILQSKEGDTQLVMKKTVPVRLLKNNFYQQIQEAENRGALPDELNEILGKGRAKKGMFEGNLEDGELEIGQVAALINQIKPAGDIVKEIWHEYNQELQQLTNQQFTLATKHL